MVMKEKQQECVDFHNGYSGFGKILCLPSLTLPAEIYQHQWGFQPLWGSCLSPCHTWVGDLCVLKVTWILPLASFLFTSMLSLILKRSPFWAPFVFFFHSCTAPALICLVVPLPLSPPLISPLTLFTSFSSVKFFKKHLRENSTEAISLWWKSPFYSIWYDQIHFCP